MSYYFSKICPLPFEQAIEKVKEQLKIEGFGVLTEIDMKATMKLKLDVDLPKYTILGACNPPMAHKALMAEDKIGLMLPCNVIVQEKMLENGESLTEVSAINPEFAMEQVNNEALTEIAKMVSQKLQKVITSL